MSRSVNNNDPIKIHSDQLTIEIAPPGYVYAGTRFDWTGFITQITLTTPEKIQHTFCVPESLEAGKGTGGWGLCNEFGNDKPIGYYDIQPGESFPKMGIGLLKRPDLSQYNFFYSYEIVKQFPIMIDVTENQAIFIVKPIDCRGNAARLTKRISVYENWLEIAYQLENVGSKLIDTNEYCHNFMGIDEHPLGPDYRLHLPYLIQHEYSIAASRPFLLPLLHKVIPKFVQEKLLKPMAAPGNKSVKISGADFLFPSTPKSPFYFRIQGFSKSDGYQWELSHLPSGIRLREYDDFPPSRVAVWGTTHVISAEIFVDITLQPGQVKKWTRKYEFLS